MLQVCEELVLGLLEKVFARDESVGAGSRDKGGSFGRLVDSCVAGDAGVGWGAKRTNRSATKNERRGKL